MDLRELGRVLEERREAIGIPRGRLARRVGVSPSYVSTIERAVERSGGRPSQPSKEVLEQWAKALGWDAAYTRQLLILAGHADPEPGSTPLSRLPFGGASAFHYPQPRRLERERLIEEWNELLDAVEGSEAQWDEVVGLGRSFLRWLKFRVGGES